jgi:uncharacterized protein
VVNGRDEPTPFRTTYGPWAVVTGASSGIGRALAAELAARGLDVVLVARRREVLEELATELVTCHGIDARVAATDLAATSDAPMPEALLAVTEPLDVGLLVAAAGFGTSGAFLESDLGVELDMLAVNAAAVMALSWHFGRRFQGRVGSAAAGGRRAGIVLLSSIVAYQGQPRAAHYAATKAYVHTLAEGLHQELAGQGIDVLAAAPGPVRSGFAARADMRLGRALDPAAIAAPILDALAAGRSTSLPGALTRLLRGSLAPLPRRLRTQIMGEVMAGMTRHQHTPA